MYTYLTPSLRLISQHSLVKGAIKTHACYKPRLWQCLILSRLSRHPSLTGTLAGLLWVPMACQTSWSKKAWNTLIESRSSSRKEPRKSRDTSRLTRQDLDLSTLSCSHSTISSQRFHLTFRCSEGRWFNTVQPDGSVFSGRGSNWMDEHPCQSNAPPKQTVQRQTSMSTAGITLRQSPGSPMLATSWSAGFAPPRSPPSSQFMSSCGVEYSSSATLMVTTSVKWWSCPQCKRRANKSSLCNPRCISSSLQRQTRWWPQTCFILLPFPSSVKLPIKQPAFLRKSPRKISSQKRRR